MPQTAQPVTHEENREGDAADAGPEGDHPGRSSSEEDRIKEGSCPKDTHPEGRFPPATDGVSQPAANIVAITILAPPNFGRSCHFQSLQSSIGRLVPIWCHNGTKFTNCRPKSLRRLMKMADAMN